MKYRLMFFAVLMVVVTSCSQPEAVIAQEAQRRRELWDAKNVLLIGLDPEVINDDRWPGLTAAKLDTPRRSYLLLAINPGGGGDA